VMGFARGEPRGGGCVQAIGSEQMRLHRLGRVSQRPALYICRRNLRLLLSVSPLAFWPSAPDLAKAWRADSPHARMKAISPNSAPIPSPRRRAPPLPPSADRARGAWTAPAGGSVRGPAAPAGRTVDALTEGALTATKRPRGQRRRMLACILVWRKRAHPALVCRGDGPREGGRERGTAEAALAPGHWQVGPGNHRIETPHRNGVENSAQNSTRTSRCPLSPVQVPVA
jgi:hypothetical protein